MTLAKDRKELLLWVGLGAAFAFVLFVGASAAAYGYENAYRGRIFAGVSVAGLRLDGMTREQAREALRARVDQSLEPGFSFRYGDALFALPRTTLAVEDPDLSQDVIRYDVDAAIERASAAGRGKGIFTNSLNRFRIILARTDLNVSPEINEALVERLVRQEIDKRSFMPVDADMVVRYATGTGMLETEVTSHHDGKTGNIQRAAETLRAQAERLAFQPISIQTTVIRPRITTDQVQSLLPDVERALGRGRIVLTSERKKFDVTTSTIAGWIHASATEQGATLAFDPKRVAESLAPLVSDLLVEPKDGSLTLDANGIMSEFTAPAEGILVDGAATTRDIMDAWAHGSSTAPLSLIRITPKIVGEDAERLGITDLLGVGRSNFSGSPTNRRRNIAYGRKKMNGVLIPPGEIFSQLDTLGPVDGEHGWFQELVIKGNETTPEYGGGLCQVGTTSFRAALAAGLPIVERRNHSYRVRYYEPAGTDATIYSPAPDFKFRNDTPAHVLITSQIQGDNLMFFVWGTDDGRVTSSTSPRIYNIVGAPPKKVILSTSLPVGKTKCTEVAHAGATASFDYAVAYANGEYKKETFTSYYRPWGAVCLVGATAEEVAAAANPVVDETGVNNPN